MTRRLWIVIFLMGLLAAALPGCAARTNSTIEPGDPFLLKGQYVIRDEHLPPSVIMLDAEQAKVQVGHPKTVSQHSSDSQILPGGKQVVPTIVEVSNGSFNGQKTNPPPGQHVAEFNDPPRVLPPPLLQPPVPPTQYQLPPLFNNDPLVKSQPPEAPFKELPIVSALQCLLRNQPTDAIEYLKVYDQPTREFMLRLLPALAAVNDKGLTKLNAAEAAALQDQMEGLVQSLRSNSELTIDKLYLCEKIDGYGQFKKHAENHVFHVGPAQRVGDRVQIYVELRNIGCVRKDPYFVPAIYGRITIQDEHGTPVRIIPYRDEEKQHPSLMPRYDCSRAYDFMLYPTMAPGKYTLNFEITDESTQPHRRVSKSLEFTVVATQR